jgi:hypothetical protein
MLLWTLIMSFFHCLYFCRWWWLLFLFRFLLLLGFQLLLELLAVEL